MIHDTHESQKFEVVVDRVFVDSFVYLWRANGPGRHDGRRYSMRLEFVRGHSGERPHVEVGTRLLVQADPSNPDRLLGGEIVESVTRTSDSLVLG